MKRLARELYLRGWGRALCGRARRLCRAECRHNLREPQCWPCCIALGAGLFVEASDPWYPVDRKW